MSEYAVIKVIHLSALVFWLGLPTGAWLALRVAEPGGYRPCSVAERVSRVFFVCLLIEHVAFIFLLLSGSMMAWYYGWMGNEWLRQKLYLVCLLIVPLELVDVVLGNWIASRATQKLYAGLPVSRWERRALVIYHGVFTKMVLVLIPLSVVLIFYLATAKTGLW